jgi:hypothetical protein
MVEVTGSTPLPQGESSRRYAGALNQMLPPEVARSATCTSAVGAA